MVREIAVTFQLNDEEAIARGEELVRALQAMSDEVDDFACARKEHKERVEHIEEEVVRLRHTVSSRTEKRVVSCQAVKNFDRGTMDFLHLGAVVHSRPLTEPERQENLFSGDPGARLEVSTVLRPSLADDEGPGTP